MEYELDDFGNVTIVDDGDDVVDIGDDIAMPPRRVSRLVRYARKFMIACIVIFLFFPSFVSSQENLEYVGGVIADNAITLAENAQRTLTLVTSECENIATTATNVIDAAGTLVFGQLEQSVAEAKQEK